MWWQFFFLQSCTYTSKSVLLNQRTEEKKSNVLTKVLVQHTDQSHWTYNRSWVEKQICVITMHTIPLCTNLMHQCQNKIKLASQLASKVKS
jgi:hypothetical protein